MAEAQVKQLRKKHPTKTTEEIIAILERRYLSETTSIGVGSGAAAAVPGAGTVAALGLTAVDAGSFLTATAVHVFAVMKVLDIELADIEHERALVMSIVLGGSGSRTIERVAQRTGKHWGNCWWIARPMQQSSKSTKFLVGISLRNMEPSRASLCSEKWPRSGSALLLVEA